MRTSILLCLFALLGCSTTPTKKEIVMCFATQEEAAVMGMRIFSDSFTQRSRYWLDGTNHELKGLGLQWRDLSNSNYCEENKYPLVVIYEPENSYEFPYQEVLDAGKRTAKLRMKAYRAL